MPLKKSAKSFQAKDSDASLRKQYSFSFQDYS